MTAANQAPAPRFSANLRVVLISSAVVLAMIGLSYAAVPLYRVFCQVTGFAGTPKRAVAAPVLQPNSPAAGKTIDIRFDGNVHGVPWKFHPVKNVMRVKIGEQTIAYFRATNTSSKPITGSAVYNVSPDQAGGYFNKIECFCFTEQTLAPGETVDMPVIFYVDPSILNDSYDRNIREITLSYTFYPKDAAQPATGDSARRAA